MRQTEFHQGWTVYKEGNERQKQNITLPHDAMLYEKRTADAPSKSGGAFFHGGCYHYEKMFVAPKEWEHETVQLYFEGVYRNSTVILNGTKIGGCAYGYTVFLVTLDTALKYGEENHLEVIADNSKTPNTRWYSGSGIYRPVWLLTGDKSKHIEWQGVEIETVSYGTENAQSDGGDGAQRERNISGEKPAVVKIKVRHAGGNVRAQILWRDAVVAEGGLEAVSRGDTSVVQSGLEWASGEVMDVVGSGADMFSSEARFTIENARLWSDETPDLYICKVQLYNDAGELVEEVLESFGIRQISYSPKGLFINGKETLLRGGCVHHDHGVLGAKTFAKSEWRRVKKLKEYGFNAIRSAHNPCSVEMLKACDYYGVYVMDELWDMWYTTKNEFDYALDFEKNYKIDMESMVKKDRNHPSVILYSIANEVSEPVEEKGILLAKELVARMHELDASRPVTGGYNLMLMNQVKNDAAAQGKNDVTQGKEMDSGENAEEAAKKKAMVEKFFQTKNSSLQFNMMASMMGSGMNDSAKSEKVDKLTTPVLDAMDIAGYNYASGRYKMERTCHPNRILVGSETFPGDLPKNWAMVTEYPYLVGDFMWSAWDYLGEAGGGTWSYETDGITFDKPYPWLLSDMGAIDILGNPGGEAYLAAAVWGALKKPRIAVQPVNHPKVTPGKSAWRCTNAIPSWSWKGCEGNKAVVEVYTDAERVELFLDGKQIGKKKVKKYVAEFSLKYAPGVLEAVAYDASGAECGRDRLVSANPENHVVLRAEEAEARLGDIVYVDVLIADAAGNVESNADRLVKVSVEGGELLGFGSARARTEENFVSGEHTPYYGRAQAVIRATGTGKVIVRAEDGNETAETEIEIKR